MAVMQAELLLDARCQLAEGPVWLDGALWWTDIDGRSLHCLREDKHESWKMPARVGTMVPTDQGRWVLACDDGFHFWKPGGERKLIANPEAGRTDGRFNDGKASPQGKLFAGTMVTSGEKGSGAFYRLDPGETIVKLFGGVQCSNGLAWSDDHETFWYIDTPTGKVDAFDYDAATGDLSNRRKAVDGFPGSSPDGMSIDRKNMLWVGTWGGSCIVHCDPRTGEHLGRIELPVPNVTSCCFGGPDLKTLYITTAQTENAPGSGGIWVMKDMSVAGLPVDVYSET